MPVDTAYLYPDWEMRSRQQRHASARRSLLSLLAIGAAAVLTAICSRWPLAGEMTPLLGRGVVGSLLLVGALYGLYRPRQAGLFLSGAALLLLAGVTASAWATAAAEKVSSVSSPVLYVLLLVVIALGLLLPVSAVAFFARPGLRPAPRLKGLSLAKELAFGLASGLTAAALVFLSRSFAGINSAITYPDVPLSVFYFALSLGPAAVGEELFFRGVVLQDVQNRYGWESPAAVLLVLILNLFLYAARIPPSFDGRYALSLLAGLQAPAVMIIANSAVFAERRNFLAPIISNGVFRLYAFAIGIY